ncbi:MAG: TetR family transcriptional regulator C-terminal domain-containing protein [Thermoanaerobaculia bacterium]|nr:TetR family transcriptional regulator C-terminal domain-containing protein [Thermoanaerobaculia bacterium]
MSRGKSRDKLVEAGLELFGQQGYAATGVQDIADAAGVPKGSFYNYFDSKEDFAVAVLDRYRQGAVEHFASLASLDIASPLARLESLLVGMEEQLAASDFAGGCLAGRLAQELAGENPALREPLCEVFSAMQDRLAACLRAAQQAGELAADEDLELLASFLVNAWQGAMLRAKAAGSVEPLVAVRKVVFSRLLAPLAS